MNDNSFMCMITYYSLRKSKIVLDLLFGAIGLFVISLFLTYDYIEWLTFAFFIFLYFYILMIFFPRIFRLLGSAISVSIIITLSIFSLLLWLFRFDLPYLGVISDNKMLVLVTILYVFLTYKILQSNITLFQYQRMPQLLVEIKNDLDNSSKFIVRNESQYPAINIFLTFEIVCPIPDTFFSVLTLWLKREIIEKIGNLISKNKNPDYIVKFFSEYLESKGSMYLAINDEINDIIDQMSIKEGKGLGIVGNTFQVILKYEYQSQDELNLNVPFYRSFKFKIEPTGVHLIHKSGDPIKL